MADLSMIGGVKSRAESLAVLVIKAVVEAHKGYDAVLDHPDKGAEPLKAFLKSLVSLRGDITMQIDTVSGMIGVEAPKPPVLAPETVEEKPAPKKVETAPSGKFEIPELTDMQKLAVTVRLLGETTNAQVQTMMKVDSDKAREYINALVAAGVLVKESSKLYKAK